MFGSNERVKGIKKDLSNPFVLVMVNDKGHFILVLYTSGAACGTSLYHEQRGIISPIQWPFLVYVNCKFLGYLEEHSVLIALK